MSDWLPVPTLILEVSSWTSRGFTFFDCERAPVFFLALCLAEWRPGPIFFALAVPLFFLCAFFSGASVGLSGCALHGAVFLCVRCMVLCRADFFSEPRAACSHGRASGVCMVRCARFSFFPFLVSLLKHQELHYLNTRSCPPSLEHHEHFF
jgi:hypothetical protein